MLTHDALAVICAAMILGFVALVAFGLGVEFGRNEERRQQLVTRRALRIVREREGL